MKNIISVFIAALSLFWASACLQNGIADSSEKSADKPATSNISSNAVSPGAGAADVNADSSQPSLKTQTGNDTRKTAPVNPPSDESDLQKQITDNLGGLIVASFYHPHLVEGDFNGDNLVDAAIVVGAEDRTSGQTGVIGDLMVGLPYLAEGVSFQNLRTNAILLAKPKQSAINFERHKAKLTPKSKLGLLIILSSSGGGGTGTAENWKAELSKTDYDKKFLLLDVLFGPASENRADHTEWLSVVKKGETCLPRLAKGEGIFSGDPQSSGKVIYFNGNSFAWAQCGE